MRIRDALLVLALGLGVSIRTFGQEAESRTFGTTSDSLSMLGSWVFESEISSLSYESTGGDRRYSTGGMGCFDASVNLPGCALLDFFELVGCDEWCAPDGTGLYAELDTCPTAEQGCQVNRIVKTSNAPGCILLPSGSLGLTIDNVANLYTMRVCTFSGNASTRFRGVRLWYRLQVSPAPATATFADVPTNYLYFRAIEALAKSGIAGGCGAGNFCPNQPVTRGELAKFLANALGLSFP